MTKLGMARPELTALVRTIFQKGDWSNEGREAMTALAKSGDDAVDAVVAVLKQPLNSKLHPRDLMESISAVFQTLARRSSDRIIDLMEIGSIDRSCVYCALRNAEGERSIRVLMGGLREKDQYARWLSANSLIHRRCRSAAPRLIQMLKDRSQIVKAEIIFAMKEHQWLRQHEALPLLRRLRESQTVRKRSPGTWHAAQEVIELIEAKSAREKGRTG